MIGTPEYLASWSRDRLAEYVERYLERGLILKRYWDATQGANAERLDLVQTYNRPSESFSFFDSVPLPGGSYPVMGDLMDVFYDRPKTSGSKLVAAEWMCEQIRAFVLGYLLRVLDTRSPETFPNAPLYPVPAFLRPISLCPEPSDTRMGFGFSQLAYKLWKNGEIGFFSGAERAKIIDLRELVDKYEWVLALVRIFDFDLSYAPLGNTLPSIKFPLRERQLVVMSRDYLVDRLIPESDMLGAFGIGFSVVPTPGERALAFGPGEFSAGYQTFDFWVHEKGTVRVRANFMVNRPRRILNFFSLDPIFSSIHALNLMTGGLAQRELCISREQLEKDMLVKHFRQTYEMLEGSVRIWRLVPNWLNVPALPEWVRTGQPERGRYEANRYPA